VDWGCEKNWEIEIDETTETWDYGIEFGETTEAWDCE
jgi:hypothetical protein